MLINAETTPPLDTRQTDNLSPAFLSDESIHEGNPSLGWGRGLVTDLEEAQDSSGQMVFVCLFVCLTGRSWWTHAWVLKGPNSSKSPSQTYYSGNRKIFLPTATPYLRISENCEILTGGSQVLMSRTTTTLINNDPNHNERQILDILNYF